MKIKLVGAIIFALTFCACSAQPNEIAETEALSETSAITAAITSAAEAVPTDITSATVSEASTVSAVSEVSETTSAAEKTTALEIAEAAVTTISQAETAQAVTISEPVYDKNTAPVLTADGIDYTTNYLKWTAVKGAQSYMLYLLNEETGEFEEYGDMNGTVCNDINLEPNTKYTYAVAAKFPDGSMGKMSEPQWSYTFDKWAGEVQGNWVYYLGEDNLSLYRVKRDGSETELAAKFNENEDYFIAGVPYITPDHIFISIIYSDGSGMIRTDRNGKNEKNILAFHDNYDYTYLPGDAVIYDEAIYYTYEHSYWEQDYYTSHAYVLDLNGDHSKDKDIGYNEFTSSIYFIPNEKRELCVAWRGDEIDHEATDSAGYDTLIFKNTNEYYVYNAQTKTKETIIIPDDTADKDIIEAKAYINGDLYVKARERVSHRQGKNIKKGDRDVQIFENDDLFGYFSAENAGFVRLELPNCMEYPQMTGDSSDIYYKCGNYDITNEKYDQYDQIELFRLSDGSTEKIDDLYCGYVGDPFCRVNKEYVLYYNAKHDLIYYDLALNKKYVLKTDDR